MTSRVVSLRLGEDLHAQALDRAAVLGAKNLSEYLSNLLERDLSGTSTPQVAPAAPIPIVPGEPTAASVLSVDPFWVTKTPVGPPRVCPRCERDRATYSYNASDGGSWSCADCRARGRWYDNAPLQTDSVGLPREKWPPRIAQ